MNETDLKTKQAWEKNWDDISIEEILQIFTYERVRRQMELFERVLPRNERILEGGCGLAPYLIRLRQLGYRIEGIDYNEGPIRKVLAYDPDLPVRVGDVTAIPYADATFGGYLSLGVIEHFTEGPEKAIREAHRVLKDRGVFIVAVPRHHLLMKIAWPLHYIKSRAWLRRLLGKAEEHHYWEQYFGRDDLRRRLEAGGFEVREIHPMDHTHAFVSFSRLFRDPERYDEANALGLRLGAWCRRYLPWATAAQMTYVCYKRPAR